MFWVSFSNRVYILDMQTFIYLKALYIFLALILLGIAFAVALAFPSVADYAYAAAIFTHSLIMLFVFVQDLKTPPQKSDS